MAGTTVSKISIHLGAQTEGLQKGFSQGGKKVREFDRDISQTQRRVMSFGARLGRLAMQATAFLGVTGGLAGISFGVQLAADAEQATVAFSTMLGNAAEAKALLADLRDFAASTPFQFPSLVDAGKKLLAFNVSAGDIPGTLRTIGDISAGIGAPIGEIAELYGKAKVQGRLFMMDINQLTGRGIPIIQELAKQFGVAESEVRNLVSSGSVTFENLKTGFQSLAGEGGKFAGLMAAQSQTLSGVFSTLKDNVGMLFSEIGHKLMPVMKTLAAQALELTGYLRDMDAGTVENVVTIAAFAAAFGAAMLIIPKIIAAIRSVIITLRALTTAQALAQAFSGPAGWATLAASVAIAGGAALGVSAAFSGLAEEANMVAGATVSVAKSHAEATVAVKETTKAAEEHAKILKALNSRGEQLTMSLRTPFEEAADAIKEANELLDASAISAETYSRAVAKIKSDYAGATEAKVKFNAPTSPNVAAVTRQTVAGFSAVIESQNNAQKRDSLLASIASAVTASVSVEEELLAEMRRGGITIRKVGM